MFLIFCYKESVPLMSAIANVASGAGSVLRYPHPYALSDYIPRYTPQLDTRRFAITRVSQILTVKIDIREHETAYIGWRRHWKY